MSLFGKKPKKKNKKKLPRIKRRLIFVSGCAGAAILVLIGNLVYRGVIMGPEYTAMAQAQWNKSTSMKADRGDILDRNGNVLAESYITYQVAANPQVFKEDDDRVRVANILATVLNLNYDSVYNKLIKRDKNGNLYSQVKIKDQVEADLVRKLDSYQLSAQGYLSYYSDVKRNYPEGQLFAQLLGFTDIDGNGQTGTEMTYNKYISGTDGKQTVETDRMGNPIINGAEDYTAAVSGATVLLTADTAVQKYLEEALVAAVEDTNAKSAYGILMDPNTGEIRAIGTAPTFDPNSPPRSDGEKLLDLSRQRMATDTFEPGTLFSAVTLAAGLDSGSVTVSTAFNCSKKMKIADNVVHCFLNTYHGKETLRESVEKGCTEALMTTALTVGKDTFYDYVYAFGMGESTHSGVTGETSGSVTHKKYVREQELADMACGQGLSVTGLEMATTFSACINGGKLVKPYVITSITAVDGTVFVENKPAVVSEPIKASTSNALREIFESVVENGNGKSAAVAGYSVGGLSGTAFKKDEDGNRSETLMVCSFAGYAPAENPQYLCLIIVDEPEVPVSYSQTLVAPYVQSVLRNTLTYYGVKETKNNNNQAAVPEVRGMTIGDAAAALKKEGLNAVYIEGEGAAAVQKQSPAAGNILTTGSSVTLYSAWTTFMAPETEIEYVKMPKVVGKNRLDAMDALKKAGLTMDYDRSMSYGTVGYAEYPEGTLLPAGSSVHVDFVYVEEEG